GESRPLYDWPQFADLRAEAPPAVVPAAQPRTSTPMLVLGVWMLTLGVRVLEICVVAQGLGARLGRTPDYPTAIANLLFELSPPPLVNVSSFVVYLALGSVASVVVVAMR